ncbi:hypothetical protein QQX98_008219 [Neonectria punicea]|uniref:DUF3669 domain-containing protein n=1 Tax=Neonectria punicea TaxID=979145 RepID=A0ABR1GVR4_9HYPO
MLPGHNYQSTATNSQVITEDSIPQTSTPQTNMAPKQNSIPDQVLVKRGEKYWITTKPPTSTQRSQPTTAAEQDIRDPPLRNRLGRLFNSFPLVNDQTQEQTFQLKKIAVTEKSRVFTTELGNKKVAVKLCDKSYGAASEFEVHADVYNQIGALWPSVREYVHQSRLPHPRVPRPVAAVSQRRRLGTSAVEGFMMEYIEPLYYQQRRMLIRKFLDPQLHEVALAYPGFSEMRLRVHLGEISSFLDHQSGRLQDRPVYFDQLWEECADCVPGWSGMMGAALAILHWDCGLDGRGVEFQLGVYKNRNQIWMSDFGDCAPIEQTHVYVESTLVDAVMENPTWPRPATAPSLSQMSDPGEVLSRTWKLFRSSYMSASMYLLFRESRYIINANLPSLFIRGNLGVTSGRVSEQRRIVWRE